MKNKLIIMGITILLILTSAIGVYAAEVGAVLSGPTKAKSGETFTITLSASCSDGINGLMTTYSYDEEKLELQSAATANSNFASLGGENAIEVICNSAEEITEDDIFKLTFKVKDGVAADTETKITTGEIIIDSNAATNSEHKLQAQEITVTLNPTEQTPPADDEENDDQTPPTDDENDEDVPPVDDENDGDEQETTEGTTVVVGGDKDDATVAGKEYLDAGVSSIFIVGIFAIVAVAIIIYRKNKKYQDIK